MELGVAIITYNSADVVTDCLDAVVTLLPDVAICVADNDSADRTVETALAVCPRATAVRTGGNLGYAVACNMAFAVLEEAGADVILLINPDVVLQEASGVGVIGTFADERVTQAAGEFRAPNRSAVIATTPNWLEMLRYSVLRAVPRGITRRIPATTGNRQAVYASGALFAVRTSAWRQCGGFDEDYFLYFEDRDFSERLQEFGRLVPMPCIVGVHTQGTSSGGVARAFPLRAALSGWLLYVAKHEGRRAARRWCALAARAQMATASVLMPLAAFGVKRARRTRAELLETAGFLSCGLACVEPVDPDDRAATVLSLALHWRD